MQNNSQDTTLKRNYIHKYQFLVQEYELVKKGVHPTFNKVGDFYSFHGTCRQTFLKYYGRYKNSNYNDATLLLPGKRGPKYSSRRTPDNIEKLVIDERNKGNNKYEIHSILKPKLKNNTPSPSCIYNIFKRHNKNKITVKMREEKIERIIKEKGGELAHIDCYTISKDVIDNKHHYILAIIDSCSRVAHAELLPDKKALTVMFATLRCLNIMVDRYNLKFKEILSDNGPEFGPRQSKSKEDHPFERMLMEMDIKHRYTRPYRPQTNGKIERFWRTLNEDLIEGTHFESIEHFKEELFKYILYYNKLRPHQGIDGQIPEEYLKKAGIVD